MAMHLLRFGALFRRQGVIDFCLHAFLLNDQVDLGLRMLTGQRAYLGFIEVSVLCGLFELPVRISELLHQAIDRCPLGVQEWLEFCCLRVGQTQRLSQVLNVGYAKRRRWRSTFSAVGWTWFLSALSGGKDHARGDQRDDADQSCDSSFHDLLLLSISV